MGQAAQLAPAGSSVHYERRRPEDTVLYRLVQEHAESFFAQVEAKSGASLPEFVKEEFDAFLECGMLAHGFLRLRCDQCAHEAGGLLLQAARILPILRGAAHGGERRPPGRTRHPACTRAPMGAFVADSVAHPARRPAATAHAVAAPHPLAF